MINKIEVSSDGGRTWVEMSESILTCALRCEHPFNWLVRAFTMGGRVDGRYRECSLTRIKKHGIDSWRYWVDNYKVFLPPGVSPFVELEPVGESPLKKLIGTLCGLPVYATDKLPTIFVRFSEPSEIEVEPETWRDRPPLL